MSARPYVVWSRHASSSAGGDPAYYVTRFATLKAAEDKARHLIAHSKRLGGPYATLVTNETNSKLDAPTVKRFLVEGWDCREWEHVCPVPERVQRVTKDKPLVIRHGATP